MITKDQHKHSYETEKSVKVMLHKGEVYPNGTVTLGHMIGYDLFKKRICACGASFVCGFERTIL